MKNLVGFCLLAFSLFLAVPGCGSSEPSNIAEDAEQSAVEEYEALLEADQSAMSSEPPAEQ